MEQNNQNFISLKDLAIAEEQKFYENYPDRRPKRGQNEINPNLSEEERNKVFQQDQLHHRVRWVMGDYFSNIMSSANGYNSVIAVPWKLVRSLMGSERALRIATGDIELTEEMVDDFLNELQATRPIPTYPEVAGKIQRMRSPDSTVTYAECIWLFIFCSWLGCATAAMNAAVTDIVRQSKEEEKFSFSLNVFQLSKIGHQDEKSAAAVTRSQNILIAVSDQYYNLADILDHM